MAKQQPGPPNKRSAKSSLETRNKSGTLRLHALVGHQAIARFVRADASPPFNLAPFGKLLRGHADIATTQIYTTVAKHLPRG